MYLQAKQDFSGACPHQEKLELLNLKSYRVTVIPNKIGQLEHL